ncbi:MAG: TonB-dependent receptor [Gammaproteobacteria bacterium]
MQSFLLSRHLRHWLFVLLAGAALSAHGASNYAGRPLRAILAELQGPDLTLIYNDQLVSGSMIVQSEPQSSGRLPVLREILAPHGLKLRQIGPQAWVIVATSSDSQAAAPPGQAAAALPARGLDEVVVTTSQYRLAQKNPQPQTFITQANLRSLPKLADEPLRAVHRLPGAASNGLSGLAYMRGGDGRETGLLLDGMPLIEPFHMKEFLGPVSVLDAQIVDGLDVYAGGFPADYGGRMSAIVDAESISPPTDNPYGLGLSLFHTSALATGTFADDRGRFVASARRSNLADVIDIAGSNLGEPRYLDTFLKAGYALDDATMLTAHFLFARDRIELNNSKKTEFAETADQNAYLWITAEHNWSANVAGHALLGWSSVDNDRTGSVQDPGSRTGDVEDHRYTRSSLMKLSLDFGNDAIQWRVGINAAWLQARYNYQSALTTDAGYPFPNSAPTSTMREARLEPEGTDIGMFVASRWQLAENLTGEFGLRWDNQTYDSAGGAKQLSPRVNLLYDLSDQTRLRVSWGRFFQDQGINELQVEDGIDHYFAAQRADHLILSLEHTWADRISTRIEAYYKDYETLMPRFENLFDPLVLLPELQSYRIEVNPGTGVVRGVEILIQDRADQPWGWWLSYTWSRAEEKVDDSYVARSWDQRHAFNGGVRWTDGPWELSLAGTWHTGWPTTPVRLDVAGDAVIGERNSIHFGDFRSLDLRAAYTFDLGSSELLTFVELTNMLGFKNPCCAEYSVTDDGDGTPVLREDIDYWPRFVPNLGVYWRF